MSSGWFGPILATTSGLGFPAENPHAGAGKAGIMRHYGDNKGICPCSQSHCRHACEIPSITYSVQNQFGIFTDVCWTEKVVYFIFCCFEKSHSVIDHFSVEWCVSFCVESEKEMKSSSLNFNDWVINGHSNNPKPEIREAGAVINRRCKKNLAVAPRHGHPPLPLCRLTREA